MAQQLTNALFILRRKQVEARTGLGRSSIYALIAANQFPRQVQLSTRAVGWKESDITAWLESRTTKGGV